MSRFSRLLYSVLNSKTLNRNFYRSPQVIGTSCYYYIFPRPVPRTWRLFKTWIFCGGSLIISCVGSGAALVLTKLYDFKVPPRLSFWAKLARTEEWAKYKQIWIKLSINPLDQ